jgi:hypothetical protein
MGQLTLGLRRGGQRERRRSGRYWASAPLPCSARSGCAVLRWLSCPRVLGTCHTEHISSAPMGTAMPLAAPAQGSSHPVAPAVAHRASGGARWAGMIGREAMARVRGTADLLNHGTGNHDHGSKLLLCYGSCTRAAKARNSRGISGPALLKTISVAPRASRSARRARSSLDVPVKVSRFASVIGTWARSCSFISIRFLHLRSFIRVDEWGDTR